MAKYKTQSLLSLTKTFESCLLFFPFSPILSARCVCTTPSVCLPAILERQTDQTRIPDALLPRRFARRRGRLPHRDISHIHRYACDVRYENGPRLIYSSVQMCLCLVWFFLLCFFYVVQLLLLASFAEPPGQIF